MRQFILLCFTLIFHLSSLSQRDSLGGRFLLDTSQKLKKITATKKHSPKLAALFSAVAPGAGQIYNGRYWKAPIVWAGLGGFTYLWIRENNRYQEAKEVYLTLIDTIPSNNLSLNGTSILSVVQSTKNVYRNQRDMYLLLGIVFYSLNIVDAAVDAHFKNFDVSDDLSLHWDFDLKNYPTKASVPSLTLNFTLKK